MHTREISVGEICEILGVRHYGGNRTVNGLIKLVASRSTVGSLVTFCGNEKVLPEILARQEITAIITRESVYQSNQAALTDHSVIIADSPIEAFYQLHRYLCESTGFYDEHRHERQMGMDCTIHPMAEVEDGVRIGDHVRIGPFCHIRKGTTIGNHCVIDANTTIGGDGFEVKSFNGIPGIVPHCGGVVIGDNVEIGAGCVIDKALFEGATAIGDNTKIDNMVQIAHNCTIGSDVVICAGVQISGSVAIGDRCYLGPSVSVRDQVMIAGDVIMGIGAVVVKHITGRGTYVGIPAKPLAKHPPCGT